MNTIKFTIQSDVKVNFSKYFTFNIVKYEFLNFTILLPNNFKTGTKNLFVLGRRRRKIGNPLLFFKSYHNIMISTGK